MDRSSARPLTFQKGRFDKWNAASKYVLETFGFIGRLKAKDVALRILNLGIDTSTPTGKLMLNVIGGWPSSSVR